MKKETFKIFKQPISNPPVNQFEKIEYGLFSFELEHNYDGLYLATARIRGSKHIIAKTAYGKAEDVLKEIEDKLTKILEENNKMFPILKLF